MPMSEAQIDRWLERGSKFFKTVTRNPVVRAELLDRGLSDEELAQGWALYSGLHGFNAEGKSRAATSATASGRALAALDAWDAPAYKTTKAVLDAHYLAVSTYLFEKLEARVGPSAVVGVELFLDRIAALREGKADGIEPAVGRAAVDLLATRKLIDREREAELRGFIAQVRQGARSQEVVPATPADPRRDESAERFARWLHEWREIARVAVVRRDYRISLGLAQRRSSGRDGDEDIEIEDEDTEGEGEEGGGKE